MRGRHPFTDTKQSQRFPRRSYWSAFTLLEFHFNIAPRFLRTSTMCFPMRAVQLQVMPQHHRSLHRQHSRGSRLLFRPFLLSFPLRTPSSARARLVGPSELRRNPFARLYELLQIDPRLVAGTMQRMNDILRCYVSSSPRRVWTASQACHYYFGNAASVIDELLT